MPRHATRTSWKKGETGNAKGRPPGSPDIVPTVRQIVTAVREGREQEIKAALERVAGNPRTVLAFLELSARLSREIGPGSDEGGGPRIILMGRDTTIEGYRRAAKTVSRGRDGS